MGVGGGMGENEEIGYGTHYSLICVVLPSSLLEEQSPKGDRVVQEVQAITVSGW